MPENFLFDRETLDSYLKEIAKEYRKLVGKTMPAEIIIVGGGAIVANYGFRLTTSDVDAVISAASAIKDAINAVGNKYELPRGWLNTDFTHTQSYSPRIVECSSYYKTFSNVLTVRTVSGEYLIAMKLMSGRKYKNDISDIVGILMEHEQRGMPITRQQIDKAIVRLYGENAKLPTVSVELLDNVFSRNDYKEIFIESRNFEIKNRQNLINFERENPGVANTNNIDDILNMLGEDFSEDDCDLSDVDNDER